MTIGEHSYIADIKDYDKTNKCSTFFSQFGQTCSPFIDLSVKQLEQILQLQSLNKQLASLLEHIEQLKLFITLRI